MGRVPPAERMSELAVLMKLALSHSIDTSARATLSQQAKKKALKERSLVEELTWKQQVTRRPLADDFSRWAAFSHRRRPSVRV